MRIETTSIDGRRVVAVIGSADTSASPLLRESLLEAMDAGGHCVVCDLARTDFICSDALGVLITCHLKARGRGGFLRLAGPLPALVDVLETTHLNRLFAVFPDVHAAATAQ
jgi:anti-sigma B factor antagonist